MKKYIAPTFIADCSALNHEQMNTEITAGEFIALLKGFPKHHEMNFSGLDFFRLKKNGNTVQLEFTQTIYKNENGDIVVKKETSEV
jgi:hypothetical protein